ncbi:hypothetical protein R77569_04914 [Ralstonia mannitolilytica]|uniref:Uncharacterized protein n=1 Tax=Ralstonia mannitolilytica TaxID=105219 RepID=A0ABM9L3K8_9RALS|nr:ATP-dependent Clp protease proteolytic subunit [Ralstonia mannitolilytica]CAJ0899346.1 hypothetical protein R77569_04914 [Ralstonia mannitolilytica]
MRQKILLLSTACLLHLPVMSAEIQAVRMGESSGIYVSGPIRQGDAAAFAAKLRSLGIAPLPASSAPSYPRATVVIASPGGSISEAMAIGRAIRANKLKVAVPPNGECLSSCVYVVAAGVLRMNLGRVGIHRPYFADMPKRGVESSLHETLAASKEYFAEMNIPTNLADEMFSIPPESIEILSDSKLAFYRLNQTDMVFEEESAIQAAKMLGISRAEYGRRRAEFENRSKACDGAPDYLRCANDLLTKIGLR